MIMNNKIPIKRDLKLNEIKNRICKSMGYESFNELLKDNCLNNSAFVARTLEQIMNQIIFEYHDKASSNEGKTDLKSAKIFAADCFDASMVLKNHYKEQFNVIPVGKIEVNENSLASGPITLQLEIDTRSIEDFLKGVSFGIKLKK
ncbi:hypothetical protein CMU01_17515 [Elizabethkingia anophelis]|nr:hypothetical protein [Elizabethkingia anophelis]